jgi:hypothetical protein
VYFDKKKNPNFKNKKSISEPQITIGVAWFVLCSSHEIIDALFSAVGTLGAWLELPDHLSAIANPVALILGDVRFA